MVWCRCRSAFGSTFRAAALMLAAAMVGACGGSADPPRGASGPGPLPSSGEGPSALAPATGLVTPSEWPTFRATNDRRGWDGRPLGDDLVERWRFETGQPIESSPAIVDGTLYIGSFTGMVYALAAETGALRHHGSDPSEQLAERVR